MLFGAKKFTFGLKTLMLELEVEMISLNVVSELMNMMALWYLGLLRKMNKLCWLKLLVKFLVVVDMIVLLGITLSWLNKIGKNSNCLDILKILSLEMKMTKENWLLIIQA